MQNSITTSRVIEIPANVSVENKMKRWLTITAPLLIVIILLLCIIFTGCSNPPTSTQTIVETNTIEVIQPTTTTITVPITTTLPAVTPLQYLILGQGQTIFGALPH